MFCLNHRKGLSIELPVPATWSTVKAWPDAVEINRCVYFVLQVMCYLYADLEHSEDQGFPPVQPGKELGKAKKTQKWPCRSTNGEPSIRLLHHPSKHPK